MKEEDWEDICGDIEDAAKVTLDKDIEMDRIVNPWKSCNNTVSYSNREAIIKLEGSSNVANNLFLYNSKAIIIDGPNNTKLIDLPDIGIIVDLFNYTKDIFIGKTEYNSTDSIIKEILIAIGRKDYVFNSASEAQSVIKVLQNNSYLYNNIIEKGDIIAQGSHILKEEFWKVLMNKLFYGEHNWTCNKSYLYSIEKLKNSLLPYDVICYECLPYIMEEGEYCIETQYPLNTSRINIDELCDNRRIAILACSSASNPEAEGWQGETALKFMGMYYLDKAKSKEENHLAFKLASNELLLY